MIQENNTFIHHNSISGEHADGNIWCGHRIAIDNPDNEIQFAVEYAVAKPKDMSEFIKQFARRNRAEVHVAWNAGNAMTQKVLDSLRYSDYYLGIPLGMLIYRGETLGTPFFNKPCLVINQEGDPGIDRFDTSNGITISCRSRTVEFPPEVRNLDGKKVELPDFCFYDLLHEKEEIVGNGRVIMRLSGNVIKEIINTRKGDMVKLKPVGITISVDYDAFPPTWDMREKELNIKVHGTEEFQHGIEGGPILVKSGKSDISLDEEGWNRASSKLLYTSPKGFSEGRTERMILGREKDGNILLLIINEEGESTGSSLKEAAEIALGFGLEDAMIINQDSFGEIYTPTQSYKVNHTKKTPGLYSVMIGYTKQKPAQEPIQK